MDKILALIPLLPFIGFLVNGLLRNRLTKGQVGLVACGVMLAAFALSLYAWTQYKAPLPGTTTPSLVLFDFINVGGIRIPFEFQFDSLSILFSLIITGVGLLIHIYSTSYMHEETSPHFARYFAYLNLFVFSMLLLVLGGNYVILFIGWEGVGLCSYLLIGYWFKKEEYNNAAKKAFVMNRIGDLAFLIAIFWILAKTGTVSFGAVLNTETLTTSFTKSDICWITLLLFIGATGKSAQIPLYTWLPDAMAGPTPVSALIHAATMVTAGIYMIVRSNVMYSMAPVTMGIIAVVGLATAILAATIALKQNDIKKVLAYSTVSQLGYMFLGLGVGAYTGAVFHVMTHAFFKALLFLGAGSVIHAMGGEQDMRKMGGLSSHIKTTYFTMLIGCIAIAGIPPFSGFFSKDEILIAAYQQNPIYYYIGMAGALLTTFYMFRMLSMTFYGGFRGTHHQKEHLHESPAPMTLPLIILAVLSFAGGFLGIPELFAKDSHILQKYLAPVIQAAPAHEGGAHLSHSTEWIMIGLSTAAILAVVFYAINRFKTKPDLDEPQGLGKTLANKWYVDELYNGVIVSPLQKLGGFFNAVIEKSGIDGIVNGVGRGIQAGARQMRLFQNGQIGYYLLYMVMGLILLFIIIRTDWTLVQQKIGALFNF
jgi:NADH-quinone oxidoreductase subunit L